MGTVSKDVIQLIEEDTYFMRHYESGKTLFAGFEPAEPDNIITVFDTYGKPPFLAIDGDTANDLESPSIFIRVRNTDYQAAFEVAYAVKALLHGRKHFQKNGTFYLSIVCTTSPAFYDFDENGRTEVIMNFDIIRRKC